jgi:putative protease
MNANPAGKKERDIKIYAPAGNLSSIISALDTGADAVYAGFRSASNLRNFTGINLSVDDMEKGVEYAHKKGGKVFITVNSYPQQSELTACFQAVDNAYRIKADAVIVSDLAVLDYTARKYPDLKIHLSVQAGASNAESINFFKENFNVVTVILPRVLTVSEIRQIAQNTDVEIEIFAFGSLCINYEGKCFLSPYITGESTNTIGTCSTPKYLHFEYKNGRLSFSMNGIVLNEYEEDELKVKPKIEDGKYQMGESETQWADNFLINRRQICKGRFINSATGKKSYALQAPVYLNTINILDKLIDAGVNSIKIEGRQRNEEYVVESVSAFRAVLDEYKKTKKISISKSSKEKLNRLFSGLEPSHTCYLAAGG